MLKHGRRKNYKPKKNVLQSEKVGFKDVSQSDICSYFSPVDVTDAEHELFPESSLPSPDAAALPCSTTSCSTNTILKVEQSTDVDKNNHDTKTLQTVSEDLSTTDKKTKSINHDITKKKKQTQFRNSQLTDFFPVRRSNRKTLNCVMRRFCERKCYCGISANLKQGVPNNCAFLKQKKSVWEEKKVQIPKFKLQNISKNEIRKSYKKEKHKNIENAILSAKEEGFEIKDFPGKGRGVITTKPFVRGEFVLEYHGELIDYEEAAERERLYAMKENTGCYMYYFKYKNKRYCIDATKESGRLGRLVNHSKKGNLKTQPIFLQESPHLALFAGRDIQAGEELTYDYGDRSKKALEFHPWLAL